MAAGDTREAPASGEATPAPWRVQRGGMGDLWLVNGQDRQLPPTRPDGSCTTAGDVGLQRLYQGEREADARLIAAAPDLLAAASAILRPARGDAPWLHTAEFDDLRAAVAKASPAAS